MGRAVLEKDWTATPLGHPGDWPLALRTAVGVCMTSGFPMRIAWGADLVEIYNDGYREILGDKHPEALGAPTRIVWSEIWDDIWPYFDEVMTTGRSLYFDDHLLEVHRSGFTEEAHFLFCYSPLFDDVGAIGGVLDIVTEITPQVLDRRRMAAGVELAAALHGIEDLLEVCIRAAEVLGRCRSDIVTADILLDIEGRLTPIISTGAGPAASPNEAERQEIERHGLAVNGPDPHGTLPADRVVLGIGIQERVSGALVVAPNPKRPFDADYRQFLELIANTIDGALQVGYRHATEIGRYRTISDTFQNALLEPADDVKTVAARYIPASGHLSVGGDWYDVTDLGPHERGLVVGDCVGHGLEAAEAMAHLRSVARAGLLEGRSPSSVLESLDVFAERTPHAEGATAVVIVVDRSTGQITYSRAGHPAPLVLTASGSDWLDGGGSIPLGIDASTRRHDAVHQLHDGDLLVLFSDGLVSRRDVPMERGLARLEEAVRSEAGAKVQVIADHLRRVLVPERPADDVVFIVKRLEVEETS